MPKKKRSPRKPVARRPDRGRPTEGAPEADVVDADRDGGRLPRFLDQVPDEETMQAVLADVDEHALLVDAPLMRRADVLMRAIGSGHAYGLDDERRRATTRELVEKVGGGAARVGALVAGLVGGGFLELKDGQLVPAAGVAPWAWPEDAPETRVVAGRILFATTLGAFFGDTGAPSAAQAPPLTAMALMSAVAPGGIHLPEASDEPHTVERLRLAVRADLLALEEIGVVTREADTFFASPVLITVLPAVVADMETRLD